MRLCMVNQVPRESRQLYKQAPYPLATITIIAGHRHSMVNICALHNLCQGQCCDAKNFSQRHI